MNSTKRDVVFVVLRWRGKLTRRVFMPPFLRAMQFNGVNVCVFESIEELSAAVKSLVRPVVVLVYSEQVGGTRKLKAVEALVREHHPSAPIFNSTRIARIVRDKQRTNKVLHAAGVTVPAFISDGVAGTKAFSNHRARSRAPVSVHSPGEPLDPNLYNAEFVDTTRSHAGQRYFVCLRAMAVADKLVSIYVRARPVEDGNPSVHNKDTPLDANLINHLYLKVVMPKLPEIMQLCVRIAGVLGLGFYAHDILPCADSGRLFVCETGFKFNDFSLRRHLAPIAADLVVNDFTGSAEATRAAYAFLSVLDDVERLQ